MKRSPAVTLVTLCLIVPAALLAPARTRAQAVRPVPAPGIQGRPAPPLIVRPVRRPTPTTAGRSHVARGVPITLSTTFKDQNALLPLVMHTLERNLNGFSGPKTEFDRAFDRAMAAHPQVSRADLKRVILNYHALPEETRNRGVAPEFQHLDAHQPLSVDQVRAVLRQRHLIRAGGNPRLTLAPGVTRQRVAGGSHLPLKTLLRLATAAGLDGSGSVPKGVPGQRPMTLDDLNHLRLLGARIVPSSLAAHDPATMSPQQMQANAEAAQQYLQMENNPRLDAIIKKGPKTGLILPGSVLYLRGDNFGSQAGQIQIEVFETLPDGFVTQLPAFPPDLLAGKGSVQELQVTLPATLPPATYSLKVAVGGNESNARSFSVDQPPPPAPQITGAGPAKAGEMLSLTGLHFKDTPGIPILQFSSSLAGVEPTILVPLITGVEGLTETAAFVQLPEDLPGGDYQVTYIRGWTSDLTLDGVSNTFPVHVEGPAVPQLSPGPGGGGSYSVYPDDTVIFHGTNLTKAVTPNLVLTPTDGDNPSPLTLYQVQVTADTISVRIPYNARPGGYAVQMSGTNGDPVTLQINPYHYDAAFAELDKTGQPGGQYFVVLTCLCDTDGYSITSGNHFFNEAPGNDKWLLGNDGVLFSDKPMRDRMIVAAQPFYYDPGSTGQDFSAEKHAVATISTLATDVASIAGQPEIGSVVAAVASLVEDVLSLFPPAASVAPSITKVDDPQARILRCDELQSYTHAGDHTFTLPVGRLMWSAPPGGFGDPGEDDTPAAWKVLFVVSRHQE